MWTWYDSDCSKLFEGKKPTPTVITAYNDITALRYPLVIVCVYFVIK